MTLSRRASTILAVIMGLTLLMAIGFMLGSQTVKSSVLQQITGCYLTGSKIEMGANKAAMIDWTIADWKTDASDVARVLVAGIDANRFETLTGNPPMPPLTDEQDEEVTILAPVVLNYAYGYKGTPVDGYVVARFGGTVQTCPGYTFISDHELMTGQVGSTGVAFMAEPPAGWLADPPHWFTHVQAKAAQLNGGGANYKAMILTNWYLYGTSQAESAMFEETIAIATLEQQLQ